MVLKLRKIRFDRIDTSLRSWALLVSNDFIIFTTSPEEISKLGNFYRVLKVIFVETELLLSIVGYFLLKDSLYTFAITKKSVTSWLPTYNRDFSGILVSLANVFSVF